MSQVLTIVGARPQFVKAAVVSRALLAKGITEEIIHTGQHYDDNMSEVFFRELGIPKPHHNLGIGSGSHGFQTGRMIENIEAIFMAKMPKFVLVYGDTNSTLAGALAAVKLHIPIAHVEAGLRSFNRRMPEEINRVVTDHVADILFAPTEPAVGHLLNEGISKGAIHLTGDVMYDTALYYAEKAEAQSKILAELKLTKGGYVLATIHRAENTDEPARLQAILSALNEVAKELPVVLPIHPRTRKLLPESSHRLILIDPVGYLDMVTLERNARLITTDSGGVQKEAYFYQVPCVTLRDETEWVELVECGCNRLASPTSAEHVLAKIRQSFADPPITHEGLYGDGHAAVKIAEIMSDSV
jgi:UDP-GlcNAc3NAcA epimerase